MFPTVRVRPTEKGFGARPAYDNIRFAAGVSHARRLEYLDKPCLPASHGNQDARDYTAVTPHYFVGQRKF